MTLTRKPRPTYAPDSPASRVHDPVARGAATDTAARASGRRLPAQLRPEQIMNLLEKSFREAAASECKTWLGENLDRIAAASWEWIQQQANKADECPTCRRKYE